MMKGLRIIYSGNFERISKIRCLSSIILIILKISDSQQSVAVPSTCDLPESSSLCLTPGCVTTAAGILSNIDETTDPCNDFYRFACGRWIDRQIIPEDKTSVDPFSNAKDSIIQELKVLMEKNLTGSEPEFIKNLKVLYDTCMDIKSIENSGSTPLKNVLKSLGGWPVVENTQWNESSFDWIDTLKTLRQLGYNHNILISFGVDSDIRNNSFNIIYLDQTSLGMKEREYLLRGLEDSSTSAYFKLMVQTAKLLGANETTVENELLKALHFEIALANISLPKEDRIDVNKLYHKYTVESLQKEVPQIPWLKYFHSLLDEEISVNESVIVKVPVFLIKFSNLITNTEKRVVANYMLWRTVLKSLPTLSQNWRYLENEYFSVLRGKKQEKPRMEQCLGSLEKNLRIALSSYYVRNYFNDDIKNGVSEIVNYIHGEFLKMLDENDWMDEETKMQAKAKAKILESFIAYPKELLNDTAVQEIYENVTLIRESYFESIRKLEKWSTDVKFSRLRKRNSRIDWKKHTLGTIVNARYSHTENSIDFSAGILRDPFFNIDRPHYMNFGGIGHIVGHEITHGFDNSGRKYDKDGNNMNWWDEKTDELFNEKSQCIIDQYSNFTVENGMKVNGVLTLGENIADIGGIKEAYRAYRTWVKDHGEEQNLPGLNFTQNQLFWLSAANIWCSKSRPEEIKFIIMTDVHSPDKFRINGAMSNLPEFSEDFNCLPGSVMNVKEKCEVW